MLLIPRTEGVETKPIKTSYSSSAGTAFVTFDDVKVPVENLLGKEGEGLKIILSNFNVRSTLASKIVELMGCRQHERWVMVCLTARWTRTIIEQCMIWAHRRLVFGKALIQQPVIRQYLAEVRLLSSAVCSGCSTDAILGTDDLEVRSPAELARSDHVPDDQSQPISPAPALSAPDIAFVVR